MTVIGTGTAGTLVGTTIDLTDDKIMGTEIAPETTGHGLPLSKCEAYNRVYDQPYESR